MKTLFLIRSSNQSPLSGFLLIEALVALVILGVVFSVVSRSIDSKVSSRVSVWPLMTEAATLPSLGSLFLDTDAQHFSYLGEVSLEADRLMGELDRYLSIHSVSWVPRNEDAVFMDAWGVVASSNIRFADGSQMKVNHAKD